MMKVSIKVFVNKTVRTKEHSEVVSQFSFERLARILTEAGEVQKHEVIKGFEITAEGMKVLYHTKFKDA